MNLTEKQPKDFYALTEKELRELKYWDNAIKNRLTDRQKWAIEDKEWKQILKGRKEEMDEIDRKNKEDIKNGENWVYLNCLSLKFNEKGIKAKDITEDLIDKEVALGFERQ